MENSFVKKISFYYLPAFIWMGIIFYLSSVPMLRSGTEKIALEIFLRKSAHIFEFMVLAFLFWRIAYKGEGLTQKHSQLFAFILISLYAASDEIHQMFIENRAGKVIDVVIDMLGGSFIILLIGIKATKKTLEKKVTVLILVGLVIALIISLMMIKA